MKNLVLIVAKARHGSIRVGFSVSKKVGNSVVRNRVKRRLKECFRAQMLAVKPGYSYIFVARPSAADQTYAVLYREMNALLKRAGHLL